MRRGGYKQSCAGSAPPRSTSSRCRPSGSPASVAAAPAAIGDHLAPSACDGRHVRPARLLYRGAPRRSYSLIQIKALFRREAVMLKSEERDDASTETTKFSEAMTRRAGAA